MSPHTGACVVLVARLHTDGKTRQGLFVPSPDPCKQLVMSGPTLYSPSFTASTRNHSTFLRSEHHVVGTSATSFFLDLLPGQHHACSIIAVPARKEHPNLRVPPVMALTRQAVRFP